MVKTVFVVDDSDTNLSIAEQALEEDYRVMTLPSAFKMFSLLEKVKPDLILLDIEMPEIHGFDALKRLKETKAYADIPVIFLTSLTDAEVEAKGFEIGAIDFITKPFSAPVLRNRIRTHLNIDELIRERTHKLERLQNSIVFVLADIVENRDKDTGGHIARTTKYIKILIDAMIEEGVYSEELRRWDLESAVSSARLHDVGKITISDFILNKPGPLTDEEFEIIKTHAAAGERIIEQIMFQTDEVEFLYNAKMFSGYHHERWDGSGYPYGLKGNDIPLQGRMMALVDVYDALVSERPYKKSFTEEEALKIITDGSGKHFDPAIVDIFLKRREQFKAVRSMISKEGE
jgi:putative two-component system response regulator